MAFKPYCEKCRHWHWSEENCHGAQRRPPRSAEERAKGPDDVIRCRLCDWQLINGEGITHTRPCCPAGLQHDLNSGLTLTGRHFPTSAVDGASK